MVTLIVAVRLLGLGVLTTSSDSHNPDDICFCAESVSDLSLTAPMAHLVDISGFASAREPDITQLYRKIVDAIEESGRLDQASISVLRSIQISVSPSLGANTKVRHQHITIGYAHLLAGNTISYTTLRAASSGVTQRLYKTWFQFLVDSLAQGDSIVYIDGLQRYTAFVQDKNSKLQLYALSEQWESFLLLHEAAHILLSHTERWRKAFPDFDPMKLESWEDCHFKFSQQLEEEADREAIRLAQLAKLDMKAVAVMWPLWQLIRELALNEISSCISHRTHPSAVKRTQILLDAIGIPEIERTPLVGLIAMLNDNFKVNNSNTPFWEPPVLRGKRPESQTARSERAMLRDLQLSIYAEFDDNALAGYSSRPDELWNRSLLVLARPFLPQLMRLIIRDGSISAEDCEYLAASFTEHDPYLSRAFAILALRERILEKGMKDQQTLEGCCMLAGLDWMSDEKGLSVELALQVAKTSIKNKIIVPDLCDLLRALVRLQIKDGVVDNSTVSLALSAVLISTIDNNNSSDALVIMLIEAADIMFRANPVKFRQEIYSVLQYCKAEVLQSQSLRSDKTVLASIEKGTKAIEYLIGNKHQQQSVVSLKDVLNLIRKLVGDEDNDGRSIENDDELNDRQVLLDSLMKQRCINPYFVCLSIAVGREYLTMGLATEAEKYLMQASEYLKTAIKMTGRDETEVQHILRMGISYDLGLVCAALGRDNDAFDHLETAVRLGFWGPGKFQNDERLTALRNANPERFEKLCSQIEKLKSEEHHNADDK